MATADAQGTAPPLKAKPEDEVKRLQAELDAARKAAEDAQQRNDIAKQLAEMLTQQDAEAHRLAVIEALAAAKLKAKPEQASAKTSKWEYDFVAVSEMGMTEFVKFLQDRENRGWEYNGLTKYRHEGKLADIWVFRRPAKGTATGALLDNYLKKPGLPPGTTSFAPPAKVETVKGKLDEGKPIEAAVIEAEIADLQAKLAALNKAKGGQTRVVIPAKDLPLEAHELAEVLFKLAAKKFKDAKCSFSHNGGNLVVEGDKEVVDWAAAMIKTLGEK
jgi:hypothetical protein